jgi:hypothetical protein
MQQRALHLVGVYGAQHEYHGAHVHAVRCNVSSRKGFGGLAAAALTLNSLKAIICGDVCLERVASFPRKLRVASHELNGGGSEVAAVDKEVCVGGEEGEHGVASAAADLEQGGRQALQAGGRWGRGGGGGGLEGGGVEAHLRAAVSQLLELKVEIAAVLKRCVLLQVSSICWRGVERMGGGH